uniref:Exocyst complex component 7 n=1 Tax=Timema cristinae TaxID=61476 RepID=A0A7R9D959_TIMCR|nr:unnamed protein product [Timema cristinae]
MLGSAINNGVAPDTSHRSNRAISVLEHWHAKIMFQGFNKEMDEIAKVQRGYSIPDVELRECLKRDNKEYILPKYNAFYEKYSNIPFTKNPEKYIKYTSEQVSALIDRFFDVAA